MILNGMRAKMASAPARIGTLVRRQSIRKEPPGSRSPDSYSGRRGHPTCRNRLLVNALRAPLIVTSVSACPGKRNFRSSISPDGQLGSIPTLPLAKTIGNELVTVPVRLAQRAVHAGQKEPACTPFSDDSPHVFGSLIFNLNLQTTNLGVSVW